MAMGYLLAVFGETSLKQNLIFDTFADHLRFGPMDEEGYLTTTDKTPEGVELLIAVDTPAGAEALGALNEWSARAGLDYTLVIRSGLKAAELAGDANHIISANDVAGKVAAMLLEARAGERSVGLALAYPPGEPDESCRRLFELAEGSVPTYSISEGFLPVDSRDLLPELEPEPEPDSEPEERATAGTGEAGGAQEEFEFASPHITGLLDLLGFLDAVDQAADEAMAAVLAAHARLHRLTGGLRRALPQETEPEAEQTPPVPVIEPQEKPRPTKVRREWLDPSDNTWKPVGRGRPRRNVEIREVPA